MDRISFEEGKIKEDFRLIDEFVNTYMEEQANEKDKKTAGLYRGTIKLFYTFLMMRCSPEERNAYNLAQLLTTIVRAKGASVCTAKILLGKNGFNNMVDIAGHLKEHQTDTGSIGEILWAKSKAEDGWTGEEYREFEKCLKSPGKEPGDDFEKNIFRCGLARDFCRRRKENHLPLYGDKRKDAGRKSGRPDPEFIEECREFLESHTPRSIKQELDKYIIGQDDAKKLISLAVYNHYQRICHPEEKLKKCNVLMVGPSGCGKTEIVRRLKDMLNVPVVLADFSGIVSTPYKGRNKEDELIRLCREADGHAGNASCGIMFLDEFDKVCTRNGDRGRDFSDELMGQLLGMFEGTVIDTSRKSGYCGQEEKNVIDTSNILFVCMGAFEGLSDIVKKDLKERRMNDDDNLFGLAGGCISKDIPVSSGDITLKHLTEYGIKPELAGRLCNMALLDPLDAGMMKRILTEAKDNPLQRLKNELELDDVQLTVTDRAMDMIVEKAISKKIGARALNSVLREIFEEVLFNAPSFSGGRVILTEKGIVFENEDKCDRSMDNAIGF